MEGEKNFTFHVEMSCSSCSNAVHKVLEKFRGKGISSFVIDLEKQIVDVRSTTLSKDEIVDILKKTGRTVIPK